MPAQLHLKEVLAGPQGKKYGPLPKVSLPGDDEQLLFFAQQLLSVLRNKAIYRRDTVAVFPYPEKARLEMMDGQSFRTFVDEFVACYKQKFGEKGAPYDVVRTMNRETAEGVLRCFKFWSGLREIESVNPVPRPVLVGDQVKMLVPGYDEETKTLTFG